MTKRITVKRLVIVAMVLLSIPFIAKFTLNAQADAFHPGGLLVSGEIIDAGDCYHVRGCVYNGTDAEQTFIVHCDLHWQGDVYRGDTVKPSVDTLAPGEMTEFVGSLPRIPYDDAVFYAECIGCRVVRGASEIWR